MKLEDIKTKIDAHRAIIAILEKHEEIEKNRRELPKIDWDDIDVSKTEEVEDIPVNSSMFTKKVAENLLYIGAVMNDLSIEDVLEDFRFKTITQGLSPWKAYIEVLRLYPDFVLDPRITIIYSAESGDVYEVIEHFFD